MLWQRGKAYSQDLRDRVFAAAAAGTPVGRIAEMLFVSGSYVSKVLIRRNRTGETAARPQRCHVAAKLSDYHTAIRERVAAKPDATLAELRSWLFETHQVSVSVTLMWETLAQLGLTLKKRPCTPLNRTARRSPGRARSGVRTSPL
jgi:transposase